MGVAAGRAVGAFRCHGDSMKRGANRRTPVPREVKQNHLSCTYEQSPATSPVP